ncbi:MAG: TetR family transcriptional regulator C-terminal domain-containing protein, partial [Anaerolineales bacterium]|nr:TetR family transcriptional regulator C-terminal domain-containing protein [Anaerolineales bacterium]
FRERVREAVEQQMVRLLRANDQDGARSRMPLPLSVRYLAAAQVGFIQWWLEQGMPFPPAEAAAYLLQLHLHGGSWALGLETGHG